MSHHLYIDTSEHLVVGLLDQSYSWVEIQDELVKRSSELIHSKINDLLCLHDIDISGVENVFVVNGPGSYTGIRVGEGIAKIFEWQKKNVYSFCHFEVPQLLGCKDGQWFCSAFKGEYIVFSWRNEKVDQKLLKKALISDKLNYENIYTGFETEEKFCHDVDVTHDIIIEKSKILFPIVVEKSLRSQPFYFRRADEEFKPSSKSKNEIN